TFLDHAAQPHSLAGFGRSRGHVARDVEIARLVAQRPGRQQGGADQYDDGNDQQDEPLVLGLQAGVHFLRPSSLRRSAARMASQLQAISPSAPPMVSAYDE